MTHAALAGTLSSVFSALSIASSDASGVSASAQHQQPSEHHTSGSTWGHSNPLLQSCRGPSALLKAHLKPAQYLQ